MKLHRVIGQSDWAKIGKHNRWQKVAQRTNRWITPGNVVSIIGLGLVLWGVVNLLNGHYGLAFWLIVCGRICDLLDGWLADVTKTKSSLGEAIDVIIDKLTTLLIILALIGGQLIAWWLVILLVVPQLFIIVVGYRQKRREIRIQPTFYGKISMAMLWLSVCGLIAIRLVSLEGVKLLQVTSYSLAVASAVLAFVAVTEYSRAKQVSL